MEEDNRRSTGEALVTRGKSQKGILIEMGMQESLRVREIGKKIGLPGGELLAFILLRFEKMEFWKLVWLKIWSYLTPLSWSHVVSLLTHSSLLLQLRLNIITSSVFLFDHFFNSEFDFCFLVQFHHPLITT